MGRGCAGTSEHRREPRGRRWLCSWLQSLPSLQHWGTQRELVCVHLRAFPAGTGGFGPVTAVVGLTTSPQPRGGALPRAELNVGLSDSERCFPLTSGVRVFFFGVEMGIISPGSLFSHSSWG